jgi:alpha-L-rhamnosidase
MISAERIPVPVASRPADNNIHLQYAIHEGAWINHPEVTAKENSFCRYSLAFELAEEASFVIHVSADQRFELCCDGSYVGMGPDRSDLEHWSFHSYKLGLEAGNHTFVADVHYLSANYPAAQQFIAPAFVLLAEGAPLDLNTGSAPWKVQRLEGIGTPKTTIRSYFDVGPDYVLDAATHFCPALGVDPVVIGPAGSQHTTGAIKAGWKLVPSVLPEQTRQVAGGGTVRSVSEGGDDDPIAEGGETEPWQALVDGKGSVTIPASTRRSVIWDLDTYQTAYPEVDLSGGAGARVEVRWAESCFTKPNGTERGSRVKDNRNEVDGKYFEGYGDTFLSDGSEATFRPYWWRAGRYVRITVETAEAPLTIEAIRLLETRMPLEDEGNFTCSDEELISIIPILVRGIQMCAHETYMDCPYYEQLMYVGDTRLQMLTAYVMSPEDRLNQRGIELFDWSRRENGFVLERHPSTPAQLSTTFSMIWVLMLRDYAWWRGDVAFAQARLKGLRCLLEEFKAHQGSEELLPVLPGWSFMDWVPGWGLGNPPQVEEKPSGVVNLLFLNSLVAAAELEEALGEAHLAAYNREWAKRQAEAIRKHFWNDERKLFADTLDHQHWSEHSQCLALLSGQFADLEEDCFTSLITAEDLSRTTIYFSFYLLETLARFGRGDLILEKLTFWKEMAAMGFKTPMESPEPSRSDCHAWGSHPLFHMHASLAGIRPDAPGFAKVKITPQPGNLTEIASTLPHPAGTITVEMKKEGAGWQTRIALPEGVAGTLVWKGSEREVVGEVEWVLEG